MRPIEDRVCASCGERILSPVTPVNELGEACCSVCRETTPAFAKAAAYGSYEAGLRELIHLLKYSGVKPAANVLGRMMAEVIQQLTPGFGDPRPVIVPVPLHPSKLRERGFNQSEMIARAALKLKPGGRDWAIQSHILERRRPTVSQIGLTRHQRQENMRGAFQVVAAHEISGREVLLVDDVFTTGTTVSECARVLRRAGAARVWVATVARTMKAEAAHVVVRNEPEAVSQTMAAHG
jgi:ComF family protein